LQFSQFFTAQSALPLVSLVHSAPDIAGAGVGAAGLTASAIADSIDGAVTSSLSNRSIFTLGLVLMAGWIHLMRGMLLMDQQRTALQLCAVPLALLR
jgi:hypothetical protein